MIVHLLDKTACNLRQLIESILYDEQIAIAF